MGFLLHLPLAQSLLLGMTASLTLWTAVPCIFGIDESIPYPFKLNPLFLWFFNPLPFFRSALWPPQSQCPVFGIESLGPFDLNPLILGFFNPSAPLSSIPWPLWSPIPLFWDCSIPLSSSLSIPWFWDCSVLLSLWTVILWPQCLGFGIAQSLLLYELSSSTVELQGSDPAPGPHLLVQHPTRTCFINWSWLISWSCFVNKTLVTTWLREIHGMWGQSGRKTGKSLLV